jgi:hypothetical protein
VIVTGRGLWIPGADLNVSFGITENRSGAKIHLIESREFIFRCCKTRLAICLPRRYL